MDELTDKIKTLESELSSIGLSLIRKYPGNSHKGEVISPEVSFEYNRINVCLDILVSMKKLPSVGKWTDGYVTGSTECRGSIRRILMNSSKNKPHYIDRETSDAIDSWNNCINHLLEKIAE